MNNPICICHVFSIYVKYLSFTPHSHPLLTHFISPRHTVDAGDVFLLLNPARAAVLLCWLRVCTRALSPPPLGDAIPSSKAKQSSGDESNVEFVDFLTKLQTTLSIPEVNKDGVRLSKQRGR